MSTPHRKSPPANSPSSSDSRAHAAPEAPPAAPREIGGPSGPEPTRFGDWEKNGRCIDF
jgi:hypothetical protein